jgi:hypothetical protein
MNDTSGLGSITRTLYVKVDKRAIIQKARAISLSIPIEK